jgi:hypothetical protein
MSNKNELSNKNIIMKLSSVKENKNIISRNKYSWNLENNIKFELIGTAYFTDNQIDDHSKWDIGFLSNAFNNSNLLFIFVDTTDVNLLSDKFNNQRFKNSDSGRENLKESQEWISNLIRVARLNPQWKRPKKY